MLFAHFVRCKGQIMLMFVRYKGQKVCIFVRYRGQNCLEKLIYASFSSKKSFSATFFSFCSIQTAAKRHFCIVSNKKPPDGRRFSVYGYRDYHSLSFSCSRRLDSFTILSMRFCILCPGCGHGSSNTVTFIITWL